MDQGAGIRRTRRTALAALFLYLSLPGAMPLAAGAQEYARRLPAIGELQAAKRAEWKAANEHVLAFINSGQFEPAIRLAEQALLLAEEAFGIDDPDTLISVTNLGYLYLEQRRYADAEPLLLRALAASERVLGMEHPNTLIFVNGLGDIYVGQGRYAEAEPLLVRELEATERLLGKEHRDTLLSVNNLGGFYKVQRRYAEAEPLHLRALAAGERVLGKDDPDTLVFLNNLAVLYVEQGRYADAEPLHVRALDASERVLGKEHPDSLASLNNLGFLYTEQGRYADAEPLLLRALETTERVLGRDRSGTLVSVGNLAILYDKQGRHADAELLYLRVLDWSERMNGKAHPDTLTRYANRVTNLLNGEALAVRAIDPARALVSGIRARRGSANASAFGSAQIDRESRIRADAFVLFADAAWIAAGRGAKARRKLQSEAHLALQDAVSGATGKAVGQMAVRQAAEGKSAGLGALARQRQDLDDQWMDNSALFAKAAADTGPDAAKLRPKLIAERERIEAAMDRIDAMLRVGFPDYFSLVRPEPINIAETQKLLSPDEAILLAVPSAFGTHVIGISKSDFKWVRSDWNRDRVGAAVKRLLWDVGVDVGVSADVAAQWEREGGPGYPYDRKTAFALFQQIVAPVETVLARKRQVFIASGGVLSSLPFGILVSAPPQGADGDPQVLRETKWFADAHSLVTIPSIQSLQFLRNTANGKGVRSAANAFAGYGDPTLDGKALNRGARSGKARTARSVFRPGLSRFGAGIADVAELRSLARLPGTATELEGMRVALGAPSTAVHLQRQATEGALRSADLSKVRILALATHGLMAGEISGAAEPGLVFTPPAQASEKDDGFLTASEVATMKLDADWVILSACNTAASDGSEGAPGLSGLARAFFYAGARNLLVSHWPVRDDVAARLTVDTIKRQAADPKLSRATAFQQAMRAIRNDVTHDSAVDTWAHPNAWAPFSLIGDGAVSAATIKSSAETCPRRGRHSCRPSTAGPSMSNAHS